MSIEQKRGIFHLYIENHKICHLVFITRGESVSQRGEMCVRLWGKRHLGGVWRFRGEFPHHWEKRICAHLEGSPAGGGGGLLHCCCCCRRRRCPL